jgi:hypothetical protein
VFRTRSIALVAIISIVMAGLPEVAAADGDNGVTLSAYLDGKPIPLADVSRYYCDDFSFPVIQCSVSPLVMATRSTLTTLLTNVDYVTVWDQPSFSGVYMNISQDYAVLATIGWNDRISSFKARNSETGSFFVDWFYGGSTWSFCCNTQQPTLNGYDNTFSSVQRT